MSTFPSRHRDDRFISIARHNYTATGDVVLQIENDEHYLEAIALSPLNTRRLALALLEAADKAEQ